MGAGGVAPGAGGVAERAPSGCWAPRAVAAASSPDAAKGDTPDIANAVPVAQRIKTTTAAATGDFFQNPFMNYLVRGALLLTKVQPYSPTVQ